MKCITLLSIVFTLSFCLNLVAGKSEDNNGERGNKGDDYGIHVKGDIFGGSIKNDDGAAFEIDGDVHNAEIETDGLHVDGTIKDAEYSSGSLNLVAGKFYLVESEGTEDNNGHLRGSKGDDYGIHVKGDIIGGSIKNDDGAAFEIDGDIINAEIETDGLP